jgi:multidrug resistance efflux pump
LTTDNVAYISAPFDAIVEEVMVTSGDGVHEQDNLLTFERDEFFIKEAEILLGVSKHEREIEKFRAERKLADMEISITQKEQALVELKRIRYLIAQSILKAPISGVIVEGDREKLIGKPLKKGDVVFQISKPEDIYLRLKVSEHDIDEVSMGMQGSFILLSNPDAKYPFKVNKIIPIAQPEGVEGNVYILKAGFLENQEQWWMPGMTGVAKLDAGDRNILWLMFHRFFDFLRMKLWI